MIPDKNVIFLHIPKTGGTTLNTLLERVYWHQRDKAKTVKHFSHYPAFIKEIESTRPSLRLLKGHIPYGAHQYLTGKSVYFTFLRDPVQRTLSNYYYAISQRGEGISNYLIDNDISLAQYIDGNIAPWIFNEQTKYLAGVKTGEEIAKNCTEELYQKAIQNIENHFALVGITEHFDESLLLLKKKLGWRYPYYHIKNVTKTKRPKVQEELKTKIVQKNSYDIRLYNYAAEQLRLQISKQSQAFWGEIQYFRLMNYVYRKFR